VTVVIVVSLEVGDMRRSSLGVSLIVRSLAHTRLLAAVLITIFAMTVAPTAAAAAGNSPPATPGNPDVSDRGCAADAPGPYLSPDRLNDAQALLFSADITDPDSGDTLTAVLHYWPVDDPSQRTTVEWLADQPRETAQVPGRAFSDGVTHAWTAQATDGTATSPETVLCHFTVDKTQPERPTVTSADYPPDTPSGGPTVPGEFTLSANGSADVLRFAYRFDGGWSYVDADQLGGTATVSLAPDDYGFTYLQVHAIDRAGNWSEVNTYEFYVLEIRPFVYSATYPDGHTTPEGGYGKPGEFQFTSNLTDVVAYRYQHEDGPEQTAPADADRKASITLSPTRGGENVLTVRSVAADGGLSPARRYRFRVDTAPSVTGPTPLLRIGSPSEFRFTPRRPAVAAYEYRLTIGWVSEMLVTVQAGPDGTASMTWTPTTGEWGTLEVRSQDADGTWSESRTTSIHIDGVAPTIQRTGASAPGEPGVFTFTSPMANVVAYEWYVNDPATTVSVPVATDGTARVEWTPTRRGYHQLIVVARNAHGVRSAFRGHYWWVEDRPLVTSPDYPAHGSAPLRPGRFTFTTRLPGTVAFEYSLNNSPFTEVTASPTGTATVTLTPNAAGSQFLRVRSRDTTGFQSEITTYYFTAT
jgi:hypothetical protein